MEAEIETMNYKVTALDASRPRQLWSGRTGAVVEADACGRDLYADRGEHLVRHPAHVGAADDR